MTEVNLGEAMSGFNFRRQQRDIRAGLYAFPLEYDDWGDGSAVCVSRKLHRPRRSRSHLRKVAVRIMVRILGPDSEE